MRGIARLERRRTDSSPCPEKTGGEKSAGKKTTVSELAELREDFRPSYGTRGKKGIFKYRINFASGQKRSAKRRGIIPERKGESILLDAMRPLIIKKYRGGKNNPARQSDAAPLKKSEARIK